MKRIPLLLSLVLAAGVLAVPTQATAAPTAGTPAELLRYVGDPASATGNAVGNGTCDVNGDSVDDVVVGAWFWDKAPTNNIGAAYVLLGGGTVASAALSNPTEAGAVRIDGPTDDATSVGFAVGCLGDVNGDGYDDIGIGDYQRNRAFVVFGAKTFTGLSLDSLGDRGFIVKEDFVAAADRSNLSFSMGPVGDVNRDGKDDFAIAAVVADTQGRTNNGRVWVVAGRGDISDLNLSSPAAGAVLLTVDGAISEERLGQVGRAGDVNGDGFDDIVLGSYTSTPWGASVAAPGAAYVVFGGPGATGAIDLATLGTQGFKVLGPQRQRDRLGISVSAAGDIDGDGRADLLIGADGVANATTGPRAGGAAVVLGSASTATVYTDPVPGTGRPSVYACPEGTPTPPTCAEPTRRGYWVNGVVSSDSVGYSVAGIGDVNADGVPDLALGAWGFDPADPANPAVTMSSAGATYVVFGSASTTLAVQQLSALDSTTGYRIDGLKAGDRFGRQVGLIGDFDGNGVRDLVASGDFASRTAATGAQNGELVVALMGRLDTATTVTGPAQARPEQDVTFTAVVTKGAGSRSAIAEGTVAFTLGGASVAGCDAVPVTSGSAACTTSFGTEVSGDVVATFSGSPRLKTAASAASPLAVAKTVTTTALTTSTSDPRPGQLVQLRASVADAAGAPVATGAVGFVSDGQTITGCAAVPVTAGDAVCTTSWPTRADRAVSADFDGTTVLAASTSGTQTVSVGSDAVIRPAATPAFTYGTAPAALTGYVRGGDHVPTGTVEVREGTTVVGRATLVDGEYAVQLGATALEPGSHTLTLVYAGDDHTRADERSVAVTVAAASSKVSFTRSRSTLKGRQRLTLTIRAQAPGVTATGTARVTVSGRTVRTVTLVDGRARVTLPRLTKGKRTIAVAYAGSAQVAGSSASKTVRQR